jgi:hypothetical protein
MNRYKMGLTSLLGVEVEEKKDQHCPEELLLPCDD